MRSALLLTLLAPLALSAPTPSVALPNFPLSIINLIPKYLLNPPAGACDLSKVSLPASSLAAPDAGTSLKMVVLGRGTQNYTCASSTSADKPVAAGALANLFDASCLAAHMTDAQMASYAQTKSKASKDAAGQFPLPLVGEHYFVTATTPSFFIDSLGGATEMKKNASAPAPNASADVAWLRLVAQTAGTQTNIKNVYRVNTVSGQPPATCDGQESTFTMQYAADYYLFSEES